MSVRFIIGRAGTGKTHHCFGSIVEQCRQKPIGEPLVYWLLPKQATFNAERQLACESGLPAISRARVVSFEQLARDILEECGGAAMPQITPIGRQMLIGHLLRENRPSLKYFGGVAQHAGLAVELDEAFGEFERSGKTHGDLATVIATLADSELTRSLDVAQQSLAAKLHDLHLLFRAYFDFLGNVRLDPHKRMEHVLNCILSSRKLRGSSVFVDSFYEFTDNERRMLCAIAKVAVSLDIALRIDLDSPTVRDPNLIPDEMSTFNPTEQTYRKLWFALNESEIAIDPPLLLNEERRFNKSHAIQHLETCFRLNQFKPSFRNDGLTMLEALDRRAEVDAVARHVQSLAADGFRYREIAILCRKLDDYNELIDASFREHGLPWFVDRRRAATHHPLIRFARALPAIAMHDWEHDALMTLLKSGLIPLPRSNAARTTPLSVLRGRQAEGHADAREVDTDLFSRTAPHPASRRVQGEEDDQDLLDAADRLENYVIEHRIRGQRWADDDPWSFDRSQLIADADDEAFRRVELGDSPNQQLAAEMDAIRRAFIAPLKPFARLMSSSKEIPLKQIVAALHAVLDACNVRTTLGRWMDQAVADQDFEQQAEHAQVWNELVDLLDQMVELLGDTPMAGRDFVAVLDAGLESFDLALTPPTVDQVLVGTVDRTRTPSHIRATIVMGLHEGGFPFNPRESSIFGDAERGALRERNLPIEAESTRRLFDERFYGYIAFTRASERLTVTRPTNDTSGRPVTESSFWTMIRRAFPKLKPTRFDREKSESLECVGTPRQLVTRLMRWARVQSNDAIAADSSEVWKSLYNRFARETSATSVMSALRKRAWPALVYDNTASLSHSVASGLFPNPLSASVSRLETFATCPFKHFARYGLKLESREVADVTALDLGNVYHGILENLVRDIVERREDFATAPQQYTESQIRHYARQIGESLRHELLLSSARNQYLLEHVERTLDQVIDSHREANRRGEFRPWQTELGFGLPGGSEQSLPPFEITTPLGRRVRLYGKIDRVDLVEEQAAFAVIDYKLSENRLLLDDVYHGLSLQLLTYLLVLQANGDKLAGRPLTPAAAFYVKLLRKLDSVAHPEDATPPAEPAFHLKAKPRGIFNASYLSSLDTEFDGGTSEVVHAKIKKDGQPARSTDAADPEAFAALLQLTRDRLGELSDEIIGGSISVSPYRIGQTTPCPNCDFRSVCRFDPARDRYHHLTSLGREGVIDFAMKRQQGSAQ